jgi:poly-gamma-glutamate synthesis protein (capsule biosynthesis protein)
MDGRAGRRRFLGQVGRLLVGGLLPGGLTATGSLASRMPDRQKKNYTLFLCGDVMTGRGIDQVQRHPSRPQLHEPYITDARGYVELAERRNGAIPAPVPPGYLWGVSLEELSARHPDARIINLETAVTTSNTWWRGKGIHYRMHPDNVDCLTAAGIDVCSLANNHVLDYGYPGLEQTVQVLNRAKLNPVGAGDRYESAWSPVSLSIPGKGKVWVFALAAGSSGVPPDWDAGPRSAGVNLVDLSPAEADELAGRAAAVRRPGDIVVISIHWGGNWGYEVPREQQAFAHRMIDTGLVDVIHGHSSHHPKGIEVYRGRLILYGCGDFINDYEGIEGHDQFRGELGFMYFPSLDREGRLLGLGLVPTRLYRFQVRYADREDSDWLQAMLDREGRRFSTGVRRLDERTLQLEF